MKLQILGPTILASALAMAGVAIGLPLASAQESSSGHAVEHAYEGTKTALSDTAITAKVKTALHENKATKGGDIHVHTVAGVVTLEGTARSNEESEAAQRVAQQTSGVKRVKNELTMSSTATQ